MRAIQRHQIKNKKIYERGDSRAFEYSFQILKKNGCLVSRSQPDIRTWIPSFEKAFWLPKQNRISSNLTGRRNETQAYEIVHQTIHYLIAKRYGKDLRNRPQLTALGESIAGATALYFNLMYLNNGGDPLQLQGLHFYQMNAKALKQALPKKLHTALKNPFQAFKDSVYAAEEVTLDLLDAFFESLRSGRAPLTKQLIKKFSAHENFVFIRQKDFTNFLLFISAHCGSKSSQEDFLSCLELHLILACSDSYFEFLSLLAGGKN